MSDNKFHYVNVTSVGYEGSLNLFIGEQVLAFVADIPVADMVRHELDRIAQLEAENAALKSAMLTESEKAERREALDEYGNAVRRMCTARTTEARAKYVRDIQESRARLETLIGLDQ